MDRYRVMAGASSAAARILIAILGAISLAIGARTAYTSYQTENILQQCISGGPCSLNINSLTLQSVYQTTRGEVILGVALAVLGILVMMYAFLFAGRLANQQVIATDQK